MTGTPVAGIIACGAGLSQGLEPADIKPAFWFGLVGLSDFNYSEMQGLDGTLDAAGVGHRLLVFDGRHDWPDAALCGRAVGWLEVLAMKAGLQPPDDALVGELLGAETADADAFEASGRTGAAAGRLEAARSLLEGWRETTDIDARLGALKARPEYARDLKAEAKREAREVEVRTGFARAFAEIKAQPPDAVRMIELKRGLELHFLLAEAEKAKRPEDRGLASRLLFDLVYNADAKAMEYYEQKDLVRTSAFLEPALAACEDWNPRARYLLYDQACVAALRGDTKKALKDLAAAVEKGFADAGLLETSRPLESVRGMPEFQRILDGLKSRPGREPGAGR